ncbi:MAG TPA: hypothetical protein VND64_24985 [Pirellulales bacterium]|nr:hypothetical protein [Pirellulales bacterium]
MPPGYHIVAPEGNLLDMLEVELIDASWKERLPAELADRLQELLDTPDC